MVFLAMILAFPLGVTHADAQERTERRTLFQMLFGTKPRAAPPPVDDQRKQVRPRPRKRTPAPAAVAAPPAEPEVAKAENARQILVVGDFLASGLGEGLDDSFAAFADVEVETRGEVASGLVREDHFNWQQTLPAAIDAVKPAMVIVMIGANDRQQMLINGTREKFRTQAWLDEYTARTAKLADIVRSRHLPLIWVGLPAFQSPSMMADAVQLNGIYRTETEKAGGEFIDIWDGFVDANGKFVITGSDVNGQQVRLRSGDGVNMTKAGRQKMAFYVEKSVKRLLGGVAPAPADSLARLDATNLPDLIHLPPAEQLKIDRTAPISLVDPDLDGGKELMGASPPAPAIDVSARKMLVERGEVEPAPPGRVDDYRVVK